MSSESLVTSLYQSCTRATANQPATYESPVADLVRTIEARAAERGLTVSRWQTNHGSHGCTVTYIAHSGPRAHSSAHQDGVVAKVAFDGAEGTTTRCQAHRSLSRLLASL